MESQVTEDTDEECCDDPIKLFDSDEHAVYFGSQIHRNGYRNKEPGWHVEITDSNVICESEEDPSRTPTDKTSWSGNISECDLPQVCVKLVDCGQFPWYFRKYAKQILTKTNVIQESDSDREIDVGKEDSYLDDCFIVEDFTDTPEKINKQRNMNLPITILKNKLDEEIRRKREDTEIQKALSQKNFAKIDLKRNQGLVGMKISQKIVKVVTLDTTGVYINEGKATETKQTVPKADEIYLNAADKMLSYIGTELIPIIEINKSDSFSKSNIIDEKGDKTIENSVPLKVPVHFCFNKTPKEIFDTTKPKPIIDTLPEAKNKDSNRSLLKCTKYKSHTTNGIMLCAKTNITAKNTNTSDKSLSHVKDVKKTNKYKNDQKKNLDKTDLSLVGVLVTQPYEINTKVSKCDKQIKHDTNNRKQTKFNEIVKKPKQKSGKNKREISSPILPCTILPKKLKINHKISSKYKLDTMLNPSKEVENLNNVVNNINKNKTIQEGHESKCITPKNFSDSKPSNISTKPFSHGLDILSGTPISHEHILKQSLKVPNKHVNEDTNLKTIKPNKNHSPSQDYKILADKTLKTDRHQNQVNKYLTNNNSVVNSIIYRPTENDKLDAKGNDSNAELKPVGEGKFETTSKQPQTRHTDNNNAFSSQISYKNSIPGKIIPNNAKNINENTSVCNRYASAIIIKPSQFLRNDQSGCSSQPKGPLNLPIPVYMRPRTENYQNFHLDYYKSGHSDMYQNNLPSSVTHSLSKQFSTQPQQLSNVTQYWQYLPQNVVGHAVSSVPPPPPPPPPTNNPNKTITNKNKNSDFNTTIHPSATTSQHSRDSSIIGRNNGGLVKKINIVAKPITKQKNCDEITVEKVKESQINKECKNSEVVATKTQMLEELDKLSFADDDGNVSKGIYNKYRTNDTKNINKFEVENMSKNQKKPEALSLKVEDKNQKEQPKGYSPPILPIPTYQKVLDRVITKSQYDNLKWKKSQIHREEFKSSLKEEIKPINRRDFGKSCKRKLYSEFRKPDSRGKNDDAKKISLGEYKKRALKTNKKSLSQKYDKYDRVKQPNKDYKYRKNTDYSTESDLGYDSDSTMVL